MRSSVVNKQIETNRRSSWSCSIYTLFNFTVHEPRADNFGINAKFICEESENERGGQRASEEEGEKGITH